MVSIHLNILNAMRKAHAAKPHPLAQELTDDDEVLIRRYFSNYRAGDNHPRGLRLTPDGMVILKCFFQNWDIMLPGDYRINSRHVIYLDRVCQMPWFLSSKQLTLFEPELAMRAKLVGDLELLKDAFGEPVRV